MLIASLNMSRDVCDGDDELVGCGCLHGPRSGHLKGGSCRLVSLVSVNDEQYEH